ncbi:LysM peptidoglycan-binding domain-containing protein [Lysobacter zhanggongensis]|uniref:LysM peptidoglycan-binding domain-containing protein n=1 Tax=Lysobacter zhanggongensis TaxID=1774951 RepID=A0ABU7YQ21_9GAMM
MPTASGGRATPSAPAETLSSIARKFECRPAELAHANGVRGPRYTIRPGQELVLRGCSGGN